MKKSKNKLSMLIATILGLSSSVAFAQKCIEPKDPEYFLLAVSTFAQQYDVQKSLMNKYCYKDLMRTKFEKGAFVMVSSKEGLVNLEKYFNKQWAGDPVDEQQFDLFSLKLLKNGETNELTQQTLNESKKVLNAKFGVTNNVNMDLINKSRKDLLDYLANEYAQNLKINRDVKGNFALFYVISNNYPEYLNHSLGGTHDKSLFMKKNDDGITPLMAMFANDLKGKNTEELSKKVINMIPVNYIINTSVNGHDYFQFAERFKANNPYFYKELKNKFKFQVSKEIQSQQYKDIDKRLKINWFVDKGD